jgi:hypothetical protein
MDYSSPQFYHSVSSGRRKAWNVEALAEPGQVMDHRTDGSIISELSGLFPPGPLVAHVVSQGIGGELRAAEQFITDLRIVLLAVFAWI